MARSLIDARVHIDEHFLWCTWEEDDEDDLHFHTEEEGCYLATLDLSMLTESVELVNMMLCAGTSISTRYSLEQAIEIGSFEMVNALLSAGASLSPEAARSAIRQDDSRKYIMTLLRND